MVANPASIIVVVAVLVHRKLGSEAEHIDQEDACFDPAASRLEASDDHPANARFKEVAWPQGFVG